MTLIRTSFSRSESSAGVEDSTPRHSFSAVRFRIISHVHIGRNDVEVVRKDGHPLADLDHGQRSAFGQDLHQLAGMARIQVLHEDEGHAGIDGQRLQQLGERGQATCRRTDADDGEWRTGRDLAGAVLRLRRHRNQRAFGRSHGLPALEP